MSAVPGQRSLRADARRNRDRVLEVAREAFATEGLSVPIDEIAHRAGVGVGTIYRHFPTKEALWAAIATAGVDRMVEQATALADADDPGAAFFLFLRTLVGGAAIDLSLSNAFADAGFDVKSRMPECKARFVAAVALLLARAQDAGAVRRDADIDDVLVLLAGTCAAADRHARDVAATSRVLAIVFDGLRATR